jgi:hypothetical protein
LETTAIEYHPLSLSFWRRNPFHGMKFFWGESYFEGFPLHNCNGEVISGKRFGYCFSSVKRRIVRSKDVERDEVATASNFPSMAIPMERVKVKGSLHDGGVVAEA